MQPILIAVSALLLIASCQSAPQAIDPNDPKLDALIGTVFGQNPKKDNVDDKIEQVFGKPGKETKTPDRVGTGHVATNGDCVCVPYYLCANNTVVDNGVGLIDIRINDASKCENYLDVCCQPPNVLPDNQRPIAKPAIKRGCGQRHPDGVGFRITGANNNEAQFGEFPWMVAVLKEDAIGDNGKVVNVYQCGGALIHPSVVLTAAHCVNGKAASLLKVRAGEWDTQTKNEIYKHQDRQVASLVVHEKFHSGSLHNDFALLRLDEPVEIAENVDVVCLPDQGLIFDYARCFASGWGKDIFGKEGHYQVILKRVELPVVPHDICQNTLRTTRLGAYFKLDSSFICAGGEQGKDTCKGDGGSPLVCPVPGERDRFYQAGIVAWGIGCGENQVPGVYANVAGAKRWIDDQMGYWGFDSRAYTFLP